MDKISAVIITFNEERNIARCLQSLQGVADEIIVVDSGSTDKTEEICKKFEVKFIFQEWLGYGEQKNFANSFAKFDYILSLDADEELSDTLKKSILDAKQNFTADVYCVNRLTNYCGKKWIKHCGWYPDTKIRLWKKGKAEWNTDKVHERLIIKSGVTTPLLKGDILHYTYYSIVEHISVVNQYTTLFAEGYYAKNKRTTILKIMFAPFWGFLRDYFFRKGFMDGYYGFVICIIASFSTFLKYAKLRQLYQNDNKPLSVSIVITTYNRPDALDIVLQSLLRQSVQPAEIIIADDGSKAETKKMAEKYIPLFSVPVLHCWQEDNGFRLSTIRNKAIVMSKSEYIIMIDGDMLLHRHFIRDHIRVAKVGQFVQGRRVLTKEKLTVLLLAEKGKRLTPFVKGIKNRLNACCFPLFSPIISLLFTKQEHTSVRGCNMAFWKKDVIAVNGFNEAFTGWGREDSEFVVRLFNNKIKRKDLRLGGVAYHLCHPENNRKKLENNEQLLAQTIAQQSKYCALGINQYL